MATIAYCRVSTDEQSCESQRLGILEYAQQHKISIDKFIEISISSMKSLEARRIVETIASLKQGDILIVAELTRLARSLGQIIQIIKEVTDRKARFISVKENLDIVDGKQNIQSKLVITMFGILAEVERDLISLRVTEGMRRAKLTGKMAGRPKGSYHSKLDNHKDEIIKYLAGKVPLTAIGRMFHCSRTCVEHFVVSRKLVDKKCVLKQALATKELKNGTD